jgi:hypothetical protein
VDIPFRNLLPPIQAQPASEKVSVNDNVMFLDRRAG